MNFGPLEDYPAMPKIPRYYRDIVITEKIDGTNGSIYIAGGGDEAWLIVAGSKNRWLEPGKRTDNFGFAGWVQANAATLTTDLGPGLHRGEWWGLGINRGYGLFERRFSLFKARPDQPPFLTPGLHEVPVLHEGSHSSLAIRLALCSLGIDGSEAAPGFMNPEGVVVYHKASRHSYKITLEHDEEAKGAVRNA